MSHQWWQHEQVETSWARSQSNDVLPLPPVWGKAHDQLYGRGKAKRELCSPISSCFSWRHQQHAEPRHACFPHSWVFECEFDKTHVWQTINWEVDNRHVPYIWTRQFVRFQSSAFKLSLFTCRHNFCWPINVDSRISTGIQSAHKARQILVKLLLSILTSCSTFFPPFSTSLQR